MDGNPDLHTETIAARELVAAAREHGYDEGDIGLIISSETSFEEAVSAVVCRCAELQKLADGAAELAAQYRARAAVLEAKRELLRDGIVQALEASSVALPLRLPSGTVSVSRPAPSALVIDESLLPDAYVRVLTTRSPDMRAITDALREGLAVSGAVLRNPAPALTIRTR